MTGKTVNIHGKEYMPVSERVRMAHEDCEALTITTEVLAHEPVVLIKATVLTNKGTFTGMSAANPDKMIEKTNPYEVAETSAVGRALGFAGYGIVEGIASADEMVKAEIKTQPSVTSAQPATIETKTCTPHNNPMIKSPKGKFYHKNTEGEYCFGDGNWIKF